MVDTLAKQADVLLMSSPDTLATVLFGLCVREFGAEFVDWDPDTTTHEMVQTWGESIPAANFDKVMAMMTLQASDSYHRDPITFYQVTLALNDVPSNWNSLGEEVSPDMLAWSVTEAALNGEDDDPEFSDDVAALVGVLLKTYGFRRPPDILGFALMPRGSQVLDPETDQAQSRRDQELNQEILELVKRRLDLLDQQLAGAFPGTGGIGQSAVAGYVARRSPAGAERH